MADIEIPNFGELLADHLGGVDADAFPFLLACAASEDEIADRAEVLFPPTDAHRAQVAEMIGPAKAGYYAVFEGLTPREQMTIQAGAERQGASAWQGLGASHPAAADDLDAMSALETRSADYLDGILAELT